MSNYYSKYISYIDIAILESKDFIDKNPKPCSDTNIYEKLLFLFSNYKNIYPKPILDYENKWISELNLLKDRILHNDINFHQVDINLLEELKEVYSDI